MQTFTCLLILTVGLLHQTYGQFVFPYDCRAQAAGCNTGTCTITDGTCSCTTGTRYDCLPDVVAEADVANNCPLCSATGTYECTNTPGTCTCKEAYTTDAAVDPTPCNVPRVSAVCTTGSADIRIYPHEGASFAGAIRYMDAAGTAHTACPLSANGVYWESLATSYTAAAPGGDASCPIATMTSGPPDTYQWYIYVQYNLGIEATTDLKISVTCNVPVAPIMQTTGIITVVAATPDATASTISADVVSGVSFRLESGGSIVSGTTTALASGSSVDAIFDVELPAGGLITDFTVKTLEVADYPFNPTPPTDGNLVKLLDEACIPLSVARVVTGLTKTKPTTPTADTVQIKLTFTAFALPLPQAMGYTVGDVPSVPVGTAYFRAEIAMNAFTRAGGGLCAAETNMVTDTGYTDIVTVTAGSLRKKRQAPTGTQQLPEGSVFLNLTMVMAPPSGYSHASDTRGDGEDVSCYNSAAFLVPIVLMAVLMLVAMAMAFFFCSKLNKPRDDNVEGRTNMAYK